MMTSKMIVLAAILLAIAFGLAGCVKKQAPENEALTATPTLIAPTRKAEMLSTATPMPTQSPTTAIFEDADGELICTELGCSLPTISIYFDEFKPENYIVEVTGDREEKIIFHCFEPDQGRNFPYTEHIILPKSPELENYEAISPVFNMCESETSWMARIVARSDNSIDQIIAYCNEWADYASDPNYDDVNDCHLSTDGITIGWPEEFLPETVSIRVSWDTSTKIFAFQPTYETDKPNGEHCEPECLYTILQLTLP